MNRRHFAKSILGGVGLSVVAGSAVGSTTKHSPAQRFEAGHQMQSTDGLKMTLSGHTLPTKNQDRQQFILTFDVHNNSAPLHEKIYQLTDHHGVIHQLYMTPIDENKLQAVFNWRTHG